MKRLYHLDMNLNSSLIEHKCVFDDLVQSLAAIGKTIDPDELIILYAHSLPAGTFGDWIQGQMAFIDKMTVTEFEGRVREEALRLNTCGLTQALGVERDPNTVQANVAHIFPPRKQNNKQLMCTHCGNRGHTEQECYKRITEEYNAMQA
jgi:hypothetical protein